MQLVVTMFSWVNPNQETGRSALAFFGLRFLVISVGLFFATVFVRGFQSAMHKSTVNRHRVNAIRTVNEFLNASDQMKEEVRDELKVEVLKAATQAVFQHVQSGYEKDIPNISSPLIDRVIGKGES